MSAHGLEDEDRCVLSLNVYCVQEPHTTGQKLHMKMQFCRPDHIDGLQNIWILRIAV